VMLNCPSRGILATGLAMSAGSLAGGSPLGGRAPREAGGVAVQR
jgi:hypothetical protein